MHRFAVVLFIAVLAVLGQSSSAQVVDRNIRAGAGRLPLRVSRDVPVSEVSSHHASIDLKSENDALMNFNVHSEGRSKRLSSSDAASALGPQNSAVARLDSLAHHHLSASLGHLSSSSEGSSSTKEFHTNLIHQVNTKLETFASQQIVVLRGTIPASVTTNDGFSEWLCYFVASDPTAVQMYIAAESTEPPTFRIPECLANATNLYWIQFWHGSYIIDTFKRFPPTLTTLILPQSHFVPTASSVDFHANGTVNWQEVFEHVFPANLTILELGYSDLRGTLPNHLPPGLLSFQFFSSQLSGSLPPNLFANAGSLASMRFRVSNSLLSGTLPPTLLNRFNYFKRISFTFEVAGNQLSGSIPTDFLRRIIVQESGHFNFDLSANQLSGHLNASLFHSELLSPSTVHPNNRGYGHVNLSSNGFTGPIPDGFFHVFHSQRNNSFDLSNNKLNGTLPSALFSSSRLSTTQTNYLSFNIRNNSISGTIPANFIASTITPSSSNQLDALLLDMSHNILSGTIPSSLLRSGNGTHFNISQTILLHLQNNALSGPLPTSLFQDVVWPSMSTISLDVSFNAINTLGTDLFTYLPVTTSSIKIGASHNDLSGSVPAVCLPQSKLVINLSFNHLSGNIPSEWNGDCGLSQVHLDTNELSGSIPNNFFTANPLYFFTASDNPLTGILPSVPGLVQVLDLSRTLLDLCSAPSNTSITVQMFDCALICTEAQYCSDNFANCDTSCSASPPTPFSEPVPVYGCHPETRPSLDFICIDGTWTAPTITSPVLVIPPGGGTVAIKGNITSSSLVFQGTTTVLNVDGCLTNLSLVTVELDALELERLGKSKKVFKSLIVFTGLEGVNASQCSSLDRIQLQTESKSKSCKKVKSEKALSEDGKTFGAYFTVDSSGCNRWWIILVAVVCAVVVVGVIAAVVSYVLWNRHQNRQYDKVLTKSNGRG